MIQTLKPAAKDLSNKLQEEIGFESSPQERSQEAAEFIKAFKSKGIWEVEEKDGSKDIVIRRAFGKEKISVIFNTDALGEDSMNEDETDAPETLPIGVSIVIENGSSEGALDISATSQDGAFFIDHVSHIPSKSLALDQSAEGDWKRRGLYGGPIFQDLDESLQETFHAYLEERGFDSGLSNFISCYVDEKEQNEYRNWLGNVKKFISN